MPLPANLLDPIPGPNPSGENLRYAPLYDKIKEARREEEEVPQGEWRREVKKADYAQVVKLATDALATKTKDLQLAAWLTEALIHREGFAGLRAGLELCRGLIESFWDTLYPELEDGDAELRAGPLGWMGNYLDRSVRRVPLTRNGLDWFRYQESRAVGYEADVGDNEAKREAREAAIAEGKITAEEFDEAVAATDASFYERLLEDLEGSLAKLEALNDLCNDKFGDVAPDFSRLQTALEEVRVVVKTLLAGKSRAPAEAGMEVGEAGFAEAAPATAAVGVAARVVAREEPTDREEAFRWVAAAARYLRREEPYSAAPYLMLRGWRWGELRAGGPNPDPMMLEAPSTEVRQQLKKLAYDGQWPEVLEIAETAMAQPCGRAWLDLQRYVVKACESLGSDYGPIATAICSELKALLADIPTLPQLTLTDDTPTANAETQAWLREVAASPPPEPVRVPAMGEGEEEGKQAEAGVPDVYELAMQAVRGNRPEEAIDILARAAAQERSGRARFQRKIQLAGVCMASGHEAIAYPILRELAEEIERRKLEEWESADTIAHPLTLLFRCIEKVDPASAEKQKIYAQICRLDPLQALTFSK